MKLDSIDCNILNILQQDCTQPIQAIANQVGLTNNPCWRRIKRMEENGIIKRRTAVIDRQLIGLGTTAFVSIRIDSHNADWMTQFAKCIEGMSEIVECHRMAGDVDYLLKIVVKDLKHYDSVYRRLVADVPGLIDVSSAFSMEEMKAVSIIDASTVPLNPAA
jgi:Lrp/AsnC family transcriptional regulator